MDITDIIKQDLRGHAYVAARGLSTRVKRSTAPTWEEVNAEFVEKLPAVLNILASVEMLKKVRRIL